LKIPFLPLLIKQIIRCVFYAVIPPHTEIGKNVLFINNTLGVVLSQRCIIRNNVVINIHVTMGRRRGYWRSRLVGHDEESDGGGVPMIGNNVYIGGGARLLGRIRIGDNAIIGANAVVLTDVPANATAVGVPARIILKKPNSKSSSTYNG